MWETLSLRTKFNLLEGASTVPMGLLVENQELVTMVKRGDSYEACLAYINENW